MTPSQRYSNNGTDIADFDAVRLAVARAMARLLNLRLLTIVPKSLNETVSFVSAFSVRLKISIRTMPNIRVCAAAKLPSIKTAN